VGGLLADRIGAPATVRLSGGICIIAALLFAVQLSRIRKLVRPIYEQAGILPASVPPAMTADS
jgi:nitrate/nitrite transporter NarK